MARKTVAAPCTPSAKTNSAMNLIFDHQVFSWQVHGGISRYFVELALLLAKEHGCSVKVVAPFHVNTYLRRQREIDVVGRYLPKIPYTVSLFKKITAVLTSRELHRHPPDLVHETYYFPKKLAPQKTPTVVTVHDMIHERYPAFFPNQHYIVEAKKKAVSRADHVICVSERTKQDLLSRLDLPADKISVVHHGVTALNGDALPGERVCADPYLLFVGERGLHKNFMQLLAALHLSARLRDDCKLVCFGGGIFSDREKQGIQHHGLQRQVMQVAGSDPYLGNLYRHAAAFVCPSLYEGFGMPILEAMACNCPVICSDSGSLPEVAGAAARYFDPNDPESIKEAIEEVVYSDSLRLALAAAGRERARLFTWEKCATETLAVYQDVRRQNGSP